MNGMVSNGRRGDQVAQCERGRRIPPVFGALWFIAALMGGPVLASESPLTVDEAVQMAVSANPQVRSSRARWDSAVHSIKPNYAPADPSVSVFNLDSPTNGFTNAASQSFQLNQPLQFPGKGYLQGENARRVADIARLAYEATVRDVRAQAESAFYQIQLDQALNQVATENREHLRRVLHVAEVAYAANRVTQADFVSAEFELAAAEQQQRQLQVAEANDRTTLNQILARPIAERVELDSHIELHPLSARLDDLVNQAGRVRQEILQAALSAQNAESALMLAKLEYAPDFSVGYIFDRFLQPSAPPVAGQTETHGVSLSLTVPLFFWLKQREDVTRASSDLEAARADVSTVQAQTAALVTTLFRQAHLTYETAQLYRDSLTPLAQQGFEVALVAYEGGKVDFVTLATALRQRNDARVAYLQAANQFLAQRVALEQAVGQPLKG